MRTRGRSPFLCLVLVLPSLLPAAAAVAGADVRVISCALLDDCYCHLTDGFVDPGELLYLTARFKNVGDAPAEGLTGVVSLVAGGRPDSGFGSFERSTPLAPGATWSKSFWVVTTAACTELVDIDITGLRSTTGSYPDDLTTCDYVVGGGLAVCDPCCEVEDIQPIAPIYVVKSGVTSSDVSLLWEPDPAPSASGFNTYVGVGTAAKSEISAARLDGPWGTAPGCADKPYAGCVAGAASGPADSVHFYQVRGLCATLEAE